MLARLSRMARLARWLGPWTDQTLRPRGARRSTIRIQGDSGEIDAWVYRPEKEALGKLLLVPGLHYLGPADPRLDRFIAVLADIGILVVCPFLPEFRNLRVGPSLISDTRAAYEALLAMPEAPERKPAVFSISFGSFPAIYLAASEKHGDSIGALTLFGGYSSFEDVIRFSLEGDDGRPHDPLNRPAVFLNLIEHFVGVPDNRDPLRDAWVSYVRQTWGQPDMKERRNWEPVARRVASRTPPEFRELFLKGTGAIDGGPELVKAALELGRPSLQHLDTSDVCKHVRCPVTIIHGRDDDVIPHRHAAELADALPDDIPVKICLTGIYTHTGPGAISPGAVRSELESMLGIVEAIVDCVGYHS